MADMIVAIGMDPGPTPGLVKLTYALDQLMDVHVVQCTANASLDVLDMWLRDVPAKAECYAQVEKFVIGAKSYRTGTPGARTRDLAGSAVTLMATHSAHVELRDASKAKAWATDDRLWRAGLLVHVKGMTHAKDAARHALYTAVHEGLIPDPLSRKAARRA